MLRRNNASRFLGGFSGIMFHTGALASMALAKTEKYRDAVQEQLTELDALIRAGQGLAARHQLEVMAKRKIPREYCVEFAGLAWRAGSPALGLRVLFPYVRAVRVEPVPEPELLEYAACLVKMDATEEALILLEKVSPETYPRALLFRAYGLLNQWNCAEAIPLLKQFVLAQGISEYQRLVGKVNLAASLVYERNFTEAIPLLNAISLQAEEEKNFLLLGNILEITAAAHIFQNQLDQAEAMIEKANHLLKDSGAYDELFSKKWAAILHFLRNNKSEETISELHSVREQAETHKHWETVRDCDRYEAINRTDEGLLLRLYFGTPFKSFRERLLQEFPKKISLPQSYILRLGDNLSGEPVVIDALVNPNSKMELENGQVLYRLFEALMQDFYRPLRIAPLHFKLYPDEYFNPNSSPARVHVSIGRLRDWIKKYNLPLEVTEESGAYRLAATGPCRIHVPLTPLVFRRVSHELEILKEHFKQEPFTSTEAAQLLGKSNRTLQRLLGDAVNESRLSRSGTKSSTKYRF